MKKLFSIFSFIIAISCVINGCRKGKGPSFYENGTPVTLSASPTTVVPTAADSTNNVVAFSWTSPKYATDTSNYKFIVEIDSTGRNFSKATKIEVIGNHQTHLPAASLNAMLLNYGFSLGTPYALDVRVVSSYSNNNEQYTSNVAKITVTPFY